MFPFLYVFDRKATKFLGKQLNLKSPCYEVVTLHPSSALLPVVASQQRDSIVTTLCRCIETLWPIIESDLDPEKKKSCRAHSCSSRSLNQSLYYPFPPLANEMQ